MAKSNSTQTIRRIPQVIPGRPVDPMVADHQADRNVRIMRELQQQKVAAAANTLSGLTDVSVPAPTNGQVLEYITADGKWEAVTPSAGGNVTYSTVEASRPAGASGDIFLPTDGYHVERKGASVWSPWGPLWPLTEPVDADYAWVNQGTASVETSRGGIYLADVIGNTATKAALRDKVAPATPYTVTAYAKININVARQFLQAGFFFRESSTGKFVSFHQDRSFLWVSNWSSATVTTATPYQSQALVGYPEWFQLADDGTNLHFRVSRDGYHFIELFSVGRTVFLAGGPDHIGFFVNSENVDAGADQAIGLLLLSWKEA